MQLACLVDFTAHSTLPSHFTIRMVQRVAITCAVHDVRSEPWRVRESELARGRGRRCGQRARGVLSLCVVFGLLTIHSTPDCLVSRNIHVRTMQYALPAFRVAYDNAAFCAEHRPTDRCPLARCSFSAWCPLCPASCPPAPLACTFACCCLYFSNRSSPLMT